MSNKRTKSSGWRVTATHLLFGAFGLVELSVLIASKAAGKANPYFSR
jgi:hypothetical protein